MVFKTTRLQQILKTGALLSPRAAKEIQGKDLEVFTPGKEDQLFSAFDCVFAAVGTDSGQARYGNILLQFKDQRANQGWGSPSSGYHFMEVENKGAALDRNLQAKFGNTIFDAEDWSNYLGFKIIEEIRKLPDDQRKSLLSELNNAGARRAFWDIVERKSLGYIEAKFKSSVSLNDVEKIFVPKELINEIAAWPEAKAWKDKLQPY